MNTFHRSPSVHVSTRTLFYLWFKHILLSILTLSWYRFFTRTQIRQYIWKSIALDGEAFEYTGKGVDLLIGFLKAMGFFILGYPLIFAVEFFTTGLLNALFTALFLIIFVFLGSAAYFGALRYRLSRTNHRGIHFGLDGSAFEYALLSLKHSVLIVVSLGFSIPLVHRQNYGYIVSHMRYGESYFTFDGTQRLRYSEFVWPFVLMPLSLGLSWFWCSASLTRHLVNHISIKGLRLSTKVSGAHLCGFNLMKFFFFVVSGGLLYPLNLSKSLQFACDNLALSGEIDFSTIKQAEQRADAASEGLVAIMGVE